jgi:hypothetical protein
MSGQPAQNSTLSTTGQVEWTNIGRLISNFSSDILNRFAKAGIELDTIKTGWGIGSFFNVPADGQVLLTESLKKMRVWESYSKSLYIGLGYKHILKFCCEYEIGTSLVALCAALTLQYSVKFSARICREICCLKPGSFERIPSLEQFENLIKACEKLLDHSHFVSYLNGIKRGPFQEKSTTVRQANDPESIARAILLLGDVSRNRNPSLRIAGGSECAWFAAYSHCILQLKAEIWNEEEKDIIWSPHSGDSGPAKVILIKENEPRLGKRRVYETFQLPNGKQLIHESEQSVRSNTTWQTVFMDTFPDAGIFLATKLYQVQLKRFLNAVATQSQLHFSTDSTSTNIDNVWWLQWKGQGSLLHPRRTGSELIRFIAKTFKELKFIQNSSSSSVTEEEHFDLDMCVEAFRNSCRCFNCCEDPSLGPLRAQICKVRFSLTLCRLILILAPVNVVSAICPNQLAIRQLYDSTRLLASDRRVQTIPYYGLKLVHYIFTGNLLLQHEPKDVSAIAFDNVCVFYSFLRDINLSPLEASGIDVALGDIQHQEKSYRYVTNICSQPIGSPMAFKSHGVISDDERAGDVPKVEFVVELIGTPETIAASYVVRTKRDPNILLSSTLVQEALVDSIRHRINHRNDCHTSPCVNSNNQQWFYEQSTKRSDESGALLDVRPGDVDQQNSWTIMTWDAFNISHGRNRCNQAIDISLHYPIRSFFYWVLVQLHKQDEHLSYAQRRERVLLFKEETDCAACLARTAVVAWANAASDGVSDNVPLFNSDQKEGRISISWPMQIYQTTRQFQLLPRPNESPQRPRKWSIDWVIRRLSE